MKGLLRVSSGDEKRSDDSVKIGGVVCKTF